jgi:maleate cis-trans isomerase
LGFGDELADRLSQAAGLPAITDMSSVIDAMRTAKLKTLAAEKIEITNNTALGIKRNVEIRRLPIPVEYTVARKTYLEAATKPDGIYIPCGGWGSIHNIDLLEKDLDTTVVTWMNAMIWSSLRRGKVAGAIHGFGKLLASL